MPEVSKAAHLIILALKEVGKPYVLGSEGPVTASLGTWDCSELVQHLVAQAGVTSVSDDDGKTTAVANFDGAWLQWQASRHISLADGVATPGALLFAQNNPQKPHQIGHVAISLGNGYMVEAAGRAYGVVISQVTAEGLVTRPGGKKGRMHLASKVAELYA